MPSSTGMSRSISTTSGVSCARARHRLGAVGGGADDLDVLEAADQPAEAVADHAVVVGQQHPDHRRQLQRDRRTRSGGAVDGQPAAGLGHEVLEQRQADVALLAAARALGGIEPAPVIGHDQFLGGHVDLDAASARMVTHVSQRLAGDAVDQRVVAAARRPHAASSRSLRARRGRAGRRARAPARRLQARRVDLDQQRAHVPHTLAQACRRTRRAPAPPPRPRACARRRPSARARRPRPRGPARRRRAGRRRSGGARGRRPRSRRPAAARARRGRAGGAGRATRRAGPGRAAGRAGRRSAAARTRAAAGAEARATDEKRW